MAKLEPITIEKAREMVGLSDVKALSQNEPIFAIKNMTHNERKQDEVVELEIALRQCERVGTFEN